MAMSYYAKSMYTGRATNSVWFNFLCLWGILRYLKIFEMNYTFIMIPCPILIKSIATLTASIGSLYFPSIRHVKISDLVYLLEKKTNFLIISDFLTVVSYTYELFTVSGFQMVHNKYHITTANRNYKFHSEFSSANGPRCIDGSIF